MGIMAVTLALLAATAAPPDAAAVAKLRAAATAGDADAQYRLGLAHRHGDGVAQSDAEAQALFARAAEQGHARAQASLGLMLFQTSRRAEAFPWLEKAAAQGETRAQYVLATALFNGDGVAKDWPRAYALMRRSAAGGLAAARTSATQMETYLSPAERARGTALAATMTARPPRMKDDAKPPRTASTKAARPAGDTDAITPAADAAATAKRDTGPVKAATAKPTGTPPPRPATGRWTVQLGAFASRAAAEGEWKKLAKRPALAGLAPSYVAWDKGVRLRAGPIADKPAADRLCRAAAIPCFPVAR